MSLLDPQHTEVVQSLQVLVYLPDDPGVSAPAHRPFRPVGKPSLYGSAVHPRSSLNLVEACSRLYKGFDTQVAVIAPSPAPRRLTPLLPPPLVVFRAKARLLDGHWLIALRARPPAVVSHGGSPIPPKAPNKLRAVFIRAENLDAPNHSGVLLHVRPAVSALIEHDPFKPVLHLNTLRSIQT